MTTKDIVDSKLKSSTLFLDVSKSLKNLLENDKIKYTNTEFFLVRSNVISNLNNIKIHQENYNPEENHESLIYTITLEINKFYKNESSIAKSVEEDYLELPK